MLRPYLVEKHNVTKQTLCLTTVAQSHSNFYDD